MLAMLPLMLAACQTTPIAGTSGGCAVFGPITYSSRDTEETQKQVRRNNAAYDSYCAKK